jgi:hypothetical protein
MKSLRKRLSDAVLQFRHPLIRVRRVAFMHRFEDVIDYHHWSTEILYRLGIDPIASGSPLIRASFAEGESGYYQPFEYVTAGFEQLWPDIWVHRVIKTVQRRIARWRCRFVVPKIYIRCEEAQYHQITAQLVRDSRYRWEL